MLSKSRVVMAKEFLLTQENNMNGILPNPVSAYASYVLSSNRHRKLGVLREFCVIVKV
jgi:hypothetical protein